MKAERLAEIRKNIVLSARVRLERFPNDWQPKTAAECTTHILSESYLGELRLIVWQADEIERLQAKLARVEALPRYSISQGIIIDSNPKKFVLDTDLKKALAGDAE